MAEITKTTRRRLFQAAGWLALGWGTFTGRGAGAAPPAPAPGTTPAAPPPVSAPAPVPPPPAPGQAPPAYYDSGFRPAPPGTTMPDGGRVLLIGQGTGLPPPKSAEGGAPPGGPAPAGRAAPPATPPGAPAGTPPCAGWKYHPLPIDLPYALRLAHAANPTIAIALARVREAYAAQQQASVLWLPNLWIGGNPDNSTFLPTYYHHDGNIQNSTGVVFPTDKNNFALLAGASLNFSLADAIFAPHVARQATAAASARAAAVDYNIQLDVALAYLDLLRAYGALAINAETLAKAEQMYRLAVTADRQGFGKTTADANRARVEVETRKQERLQFEGDAAVAASRLAQLLVLDPSVDLLPADHSVLPIALVKIDGTFDDLVAVALLNRPELAESRALVQLALAQWRSAKYRPLIPTLQVFYYGAQFQGGTPAFHNTGGRDDFLAQASWELRNLGLGDLFRAREGRARYDEANLHVVEVGAQVGAEVVAAAKLVLARETSLANAQVAVQQAEEMWRRLSGAAFGFAGPARRYDPLEALLAEQQLNAARLLYLDEVIAYNRNQFRLYWAMGQPPLCALPEATALPVEVPVLPTPSQTRTGGGPDKRPEVAPPPRKLPAPGG